MAEKKKPGKRKVAIKDLKPKKVSAEAGTAVKGGIARQPGGASETSMTYYYNGQTYTLDE